MVSIAQFLIYFNEKKICAQTSNACFQEHVREHTTTLDDEGTGEEKESAEW